MPTWKKVVISGSGVAQLSNDANYLAQSGTDAILTGSFTGSFIGDGSGLTNIVAPGTISSSAQIASDISGAFAAPSQSIATDISALQTFSSSLDAGFTTEAELNASSSTLQTNLDNVSSSLATSTNTVQSNLDTASGSLASDITSNASDISDNASDITANSSSLASSITTVQSNLDSASGSLAGSITTVQSNLDTASGSLAGRVATIEGDNATQTELDAVSASLAADITGLGDTYATDVELNASSSTLQTNIDNVSSSLASTTTTNATGIEGLNTYTSSLKTAITVAGTNVTVAGNLEVSGTTTTVDSTTVSFADNIIALNGTGAANGGIEVNDANGPASGSLIWDGTLNSWKAGGQGSESKVLLATGDSVLSGSAQIASDISGSFTSTSASLAQSITANASDITATSSSLAASITTVQGNLDSASGSLASDITSNASDISDNASDITAASSSLAASITTVQSNLDTASGSLASDITSNASDITANSSSLAGRLATIEGDNATQTELDAVSSSLAAEIAGLGGDYATDAELNASSSTLQSNIDNAISVANSELNDSGSTLQTNIDNLSSSLETRVTDNSVNLDAAVDRIGAQEQFSASVDTAINFSDQNVTVLGNLEVQGTGSFAYIQSITGSAKIIGDAYIVLNSDSDGERYSGIKVYDSGSLGETGSLEYDSVSNHWFYESANEGYASAFLAGPRSTRGSLEQVSKYSVLIGDGGNHMTSSALRDSGSSVTVAKDLDVTGDFTVSGTVDGVDLAATSASLSTRVTTIEDDNATQTELNASSSALQTNIDNVSSSLATSITTVSTNLDTASGSLATRLTTIEDDNATQTELDAVSASLAGDLSSLSQSEITTGNNSLSIDSDGTATLTSASVNVLEVGDVYGIGDGSVDLKVPGTAGYVELNHGDSDFIYLDGTNAGIQIDNGGGALEWSFYGGTGLLSAPGEIRIPASNVFSGSVSGPTVTAGTISGTINADNNVVSSSAQTVANLASTGIISQSAQLVSGLLNQDVSLGSGDLISTDGTFSGNVVVQGNLTTTGTVTNVNTTDLNVEDKFILLNSGSTAGNGGLIVQNSATVGQGTALFFDDTADRWGLDFAGADATADTATADAYVAAVVESDDANYQKNGNIRIDALNGEAYIYVA